MKVYKVNVNGLDYHVQLTEATAKEIGAVLVDSRKKPAAPEEKPAAPEEKPAAPEEKPAAPEEKPAAPEEKPAERKKPGPKPKAQTEQKEEKKG